MKLMADVIRQVIDWNSIEFRLKDVKAIDKMNRMMQYLFVQSNTNDTNVPIMFNARDGCAKTGDWLNFVLNFVISVADFQQLTKNRILDLR